jgi:hypothetical protein
LWPEQSEVEQECQRQLHEIQSDNDTLVQVNEQVDINATCDYVKHASDEHVS